MDTKIQPVIQPQKRGPYRQHSTEFKRAIVAKSFVEGTSVARLAREFNINANQVDSARSGAVGLNCRFNTLTAIGRSCLLSVE